MYSKAARALGIYPRKAKKGSAALRRKPLRTAAIRGGKPVLKTEDDEGPPSPWFIELFPFTWPSNAATVPGTPKEAPEPEVSDKFEDHPDWAHYELFLEKWELDKNRYNLNWIVSFYPFFNDDVVHAFKGMQHDLELKKLVSLPSKADCPPYYSWSLWKQIKDVLKEYRIVCPAYFNVFNALPDAEAHHFKICARIIVLDHMLGKDDSNPQPPYRKYICDLYLDLLTGMSTYAKCELVYEAMMAYCEPFKTTKLLQDNRLRIINHMIGCHYAHSFADEMLVMETPKLMDEFKIRFDYDRLMARLGGPHDHALCEPGSCAVIV
jgi:hypothetical protein